MICAIFNKKNFLYTCEGYVNVLNGGFMPIPSVSFSSGYYNSSNYDWGRPQCQAIIINNQPPVRHKVREKESGSVAGAIAGITTLVGLLTITLSVLQRRFKFLPKDGKLDKSANWITDKLGELANKGKNKLLEKYPDGKTNNSKFAEWGKKALGNISEFFTKEGKC